MKTSKPGTSPMKLQNVLVMSGSLSNLHVSRLQTEMCSISYLNHMNRVFEFIHVLVVRRYVENSSEGLRQLDLTRK